MQIAGKRNHLFSGVKHEAANPSFAGSPSECLQAANVA
jgi:hypothetical protein